MLKFRGAGQGPKALIAELVVGEMARSCGLAVPEIVFVQLDTELARTEPDPEIHDLITTSAGLNLALDYLPGSVMFNPVRQNVDESLASAVVWMDAYTTNIDRTARNTNLLLWHKTLYLIDHGAALYFHHSWRNYSERCADPFPLIRDHVLLPWASRLKETDARMKEVIVRELIESIVAQIPPEWLLPDARFAGADEMLRAYQTYLTNRLDQSQCFVEEAMRARSLLV